MIRQYTTHAVDCDFCEHETFNDSCELSKGSLWRLAMVHGWKPIEDPDGNEPDKHACPGCAKKLASSLVEAECASCGDACMIDKNGLCSGCANKAVTN